VYVNAEVIPLKLFQEFGEGNEGEQWRGYDIFDTL
jgi:hypothetical protein